MHNLLFSRQSILIFALSIAASLSTYSQVSIGVIGGLQSAKLHFRSGNSIAKTDGIFGGHFGISIERPIQKQISLLMLPQITLKGGKSIYDETNKISLFYVEMPILGVFRHKISDSFGSIVGGAGVFLGVGIASRNKMIPQKGNAVITTNLFGSNADNMKRLDLGLQFLGGYEMSNGILFAISYKPSIINMVHFSQERMTNHITQFSIIRKLK